MTGDPETPLEVGAGELVAGDGAIGDLLDEPGSERRGGDPEDDVVLLQLGLEVVLHDAAAAGIAGVVDAPADHEQRVDAAVTGAVRVELEAGLADGAVQGDE